jgi:MFS family permease
MTKAQSFTQAYSVFDAAIGVAMAAGPGLSGLLYKTTSWRMMSGIMAVICGLGGIYVFMHTGDAGARRVRTAAGVV